MTPSSDREHILAHIAPAAWDVLRDAPVFLTGGTGFYGCWLLDGFTAACDAGRLGDARVTVLTRDPAAFATRAPRLARHPRVALHAGDAASFSFPPGEFPLVVHSAVEYARPFDLLARALDGTRRVLDFAAARGCRRLLFASSGAIYGPQPPGLPRLAEDHPGAPDPMRPDSAYAEGKRAGELLCAAAGAERGFGAVAARGFAFVGPWMALDQGSAISNFIGDALAGRPVQVGGDGTPRRSYLYGADLAAWLWTLLALGQPGRAYNVGSEDDHSIAEVAAMVSEEVGDASPPRIAKDPVPGAPAPRYVPSVARARDELGLAPRVGLREAIRRTASWHRSRPS